MLLHDFYGIEFWMLPWTIGSLVAGPLLLLVELSFLGIYLGLSHVLPALAIAFGLFWFGVLVLFSRLYYHRSREGTFPFEAALGGVILLGVLILDRSLTVANGLPFVTLVRDVVVVFQSMRHTKVYRSPALIVWNCATTLLALVLASSAQTYYGVHAAPAVVSNVQGAIDKVVSPLLVPVLKTTMCVLSLLLLAFFGFAILRNLCKVFISLFFGR